MTQVTVNSEACSVEIKGDFVVFLYSDVAHDPVHIGARSVSQLLRSRKDDRAAKMVADGQVYLLAFPAVAEREAFIEAIVTIQSAPPEPLNEDWVAASICGAAVDVGVLDAAELQAVLSAEGQRGVEQAFEALEGLVDRTTFELLPITEQMENDVLRQIPVLAAIFRERVMDSETRRTFWEAVVRKYFCFARTFLEEDIQRHGAAQPAPPSPKDGLAAINASSLSALPKGAAVAMVDTDINEEDLLHLGEADEDPSSGTRVFFGARHSAPQRASVVCSVISGGGGSCAFPIAAIAAHDNARHPRFAGRSVLHRFPSETMEKPALEALRLFWRSGPTQRRSVLAKYASAKRGRSSFIQRVCLEQAQRTAEEGSDAV